MLLSKFVLLCTDFYDNTCVHGSNYDHYLTGQNIMDPSVIEVRLNINFSGGCAMLSGMVAHSD